MLSERDEILDSLLAQWHQWQQGYRPARGFNAKALVCGDFRISRQYDDANGALDAEIDDKIMRAVDFQVSEMADPHRSAIYYEARGLTYGVYVIKNPRLPMDKALLDQVVSEARELLCGRLVAAGVIARGVRVQPVPASTA